MAALGFPQLDGKPLVGNAYSDSYCKLRAVTMVVQPLQAALGVSATSEVLLVPCLSVS